MATPVANTHPLTGDARIDGLVQGSSWQFGTSPRVLTYQLTINDSSIGGSWDQYPALVTAMGQAFAEWSKVANIGFQSLGTAGVFYSATADVAVTLTGNELSDGLGAASLGIFPDPNFADILREAATAEGYSYPLPEGDLFFDNYLAVFSYPNVGGLGFTYFLHEIGHAIGLKHPSDDGANARPTFEQLGIAALDTAANTLMSYNAISVADFAAGNVATPMPLDILAIQYLYGANMSTNSGDTIYALADDNITRTIWDAGGIDALNASGIDLFGLTIDLRPGAMTTHGGNSRTAIAYNVTIENAVGSAQADTIHGNDAGNRLDGGSGENATLVVDTLIGHGGDDVYIVDSSSDAVVEAADEGFDTVYGSASFVLPAHVEKLVLTGDALAGTGNELSNQIIGNAQENVLTGGAGDDTYEAQNSGDQVVELPDQGADTIYSSVDFTLPAHVEKLVLIGNALAGTGNELSNQIVGNAQENVLTGGAGDDTYEVQDSGDQVVELPDQGADTVHAPFTLLLSSYPNVENLTLSGTGNFDATGDAAANILTGNGSRNLLNGKEGPDTLQGRAGNDTLIGGAGDDALQGGSGNDLAQYANGRSEYTVTKAGRGATVSGPEGADSLHRVEKLVFSDATVTLYREARASGVDEDGDLRADILWRHDGGQVAWWTMSGTQAKETFVIGSAPAEWSIAGTGDYNGNGRMEILWRHDGGQLASWDMSGTGWSGTVLADVPPNWVVVGTGDFDGDRISDILWREDGGSVAVWLMRAGGNADGVVLNDNVPTQWAVAGLGDTDGDGRTDIFWRHENGDVALWKVAGTSYSGGLIGSVPTNWTVTGVDDFDGDGKADLLWREDGGTLGLWEMNGIQPKAQAVVGAAPVPTDWEVAATGDVNGDTKSDVLWRHDDGTLAIWTLDGFTPVQQDVVGFVPNDWWLT